MIHDTATKRAARVASNTSFQAPSARPVSRLAPAMAKVCKSAGEGTFAGITQGNAEVGPLTDPPSLWKQRQGSTRSRPFSAMPKFGEAWDLAQPKKRANTKPAASSPRLTVGRRVLQHDWASFAVRAGRWQSDRAIEQRAPSFRGTESLLTHRWSGMDSNFQYAGAVNLIVAHLVLGLLLWVSQGVPILRPTLCWREMESNYWFPVAKKMNPVREPEPKPSRR